MIDLYILKWRSTITGREGESMVPRSKATTEELAREMNKRWPDIEHWAKRMPLTTEQVAELTEIADAVNRHAPQETPQAPRRFRPRTQVELDQERFRAGLAERLAGGENIPMGLFI